MGNLQELMFKKFFKIIITFDKWHMISCMYGDACTQEGKVKDLIIPL